MGELSHRLPHVLPDGNAVLFTIQRSPGGWDDTQVAVRSLVTGEQKLLVEGAADARYVASGHLVYARMGTLLAQPFDVTRLAVTGEPVGVVERRHAGREQPVHDRQFGHGSVQRRARTERWRTCREESPPRASTYPVWVDRNGVDTEVGMPPRSVAGRPRISPDGRRIAFPSLEGIGIFDVARQSFQLLTSSAWGPPAIRSAPELRFVAWHPDGERVTFTGVDGDLYWMRADGSGEAERLTTGDANARSSRRIQVPTSWSPDGRTLVFTQRLGSAASVNRDIWSLTLGDSVPAARPFVVSASDEPSAEISPDGRYLAYESNQSGRSEVYVQPFPGPGRRELVSTDGGAQPAWARSGRELFYRGARPGADVSDDGGGRHAGRGVHRGKTARAVGGDERAVPWRHGRQNLRRRAGWPALPDDPAERRCVAAANHTCRAGPELAGRAEAAGAEEVGSPPAFGAL